jgi:hypothetical protein
MAVRLSALGEVKVTLRLTVYCLSLRLGAIPLRFRTRDFFFSTEPLPLPFCNIFSDEKIVLFLVNMLDLSSSDHTYSMLLNILPFVRIYKSSVSSGFAEQIRPVLRILCYNGSLVT